MGIHYLFCERWSWIIRISKGNEIAWISSWGDSPSSYRTIQVYDRRRIPPPRSYLGSGGLVSFQVTPQPLDLSLMSPYPFLHFLGIRPLGASRAFPSIGHRLLARTSPSWGHFIIRRFGVSLAVRTRKFPILGDRSQTSYIRGRLPSCFTSPSISTSSNFE